MNITINNLKIIELFAVAVMVFSSNLFAQQKEEPKTKKAQISFAYPLGSNGINAPNYSNNFSFNVLYGVNGGVNGFELGAIANINKGLANGFQLAGVANINNSKSGFQIAGVININKESRNGFQIAPINYSGKAKGVQLGLINFAGAGSKVIPFGLINIVKGGYYEVEIMGGDAILGSINYKMGVEKFYTIYKVGSSISYNDKSLHSFGLGIGTMIGLNNKNKISIDASANQLIYDNKIDGKPINILAKLDLNYRYYFTPKIALVFGPSFNVYYSEQIVDSKFGIINIPYELSSTINSNSKTTSWIGVNLGLAFKL